jgi:hypothetical protein
MCHFLQAQPVNVKDARISSTVAEKVGHTLPLSELIAKNPTPREKLDQLKKNSIPQKNFLGRGKSKVVRPELEHQGPDPIRQWSSSSLRMGGEIELQINRDGLLSGSTPQDPTGDIGLNHYLQAINATTVGVFDKNGNEIETFRAQTLWSSLGLFSRGDPIILYDQENNRWLITEFANPRDLLVAISDNSNPLEGYSVYNFRTPDFPDYPKYGIWSNAISVTTNEFGAGELHNYFINRQDLLDTLEEVRIQRIEIPGNWNTEAGFFVSTPIDWTGQTKPLEEKPMVMVQNDASWGAVEEDAVDLYSFEINWNDSDSTDIILNRIVTTPYDGYPCAVPNLPAFDCIPQPNGRGLDGLPELIMHNPGYRNFGSHESIVANWITDATDGKNLAGIRWVEFRRVSGGDWELYQEGTYAPDDGLHRFMGGIAMDGFGNIALSYNVSSAEEYVGIRTTGRRANDPKGVMTLGETIIIEGKSTIFSGGRFGDYPHLTIDPIDDRTFWFTAEYAGENTTRTRIASFNLDREMSDIRGLRIVSPATGNSFSTEEEVIFELMNVGVDTQRNFQVGFILGEGEIVIERVEYELPTDSIYQHTFDQKIDLSNFGQYELKVFSILENDDFHPNDTISNSIIHLASVDGLISGTNNLDREICGEGFSGGEFIFKNNGLDTIFSFSAEVKVGALAIDTVKWEGQLAYSEQVNVNFPLIGLVDGDNEINIEIIKVNDVLDQVPGNNTFNQIVDVNLNREEITLLLTTDRYPDETSWQIKTESGFVLASGGDYEQENETIATPICLPPGRCYVFTIYDSRNDGLAGLFGNPDGNYQILDAEGNILASMLEPNFGSQESNTFCFGIDCMLDADVVVTDVSNVGANDGVIMINPINGNGDVMYSIDSGATFVESNIFQDLEPGMYAIIVQDDAGCMYEDQVSIGELTSISRLENGQEVRVYPNPTAGIFSIDVEGVIGGSVFLPLTIYDESGRVIQHDKLVRYDNTFTGALSIHAYPQGIYFIRFMDDRIKHLVRLIKQ